MIQEITIENYKSIQSLSIELGRVTVFIGENGCGKSNILEAIALGSAAAADKLDNEFLSSRGIRVTDPKLMRSAFDIDNLEQQIKIFFKLENDITDEELLFKYFLNNSNDFYSDWFKQIPKDYIYSNPEELIERIKTIEEYIKNSESINKKYIEKNVKKRGGSSFSQVGNFKINIENLVNQAKSKKAKSYYLSSLESLRVLPEFLLSKMGDFLVFCIELDELKEFSKEGQIQPLGIKGEGLFKYLRYLSQPQFKEKLDEIKEKLELIDWFEDFDIPDNLYPGERTLKIKDRYLDPDLEYFDQKSANEGFLFLLFYFCLFIGEETPKFFAIDNIDSSLNPRLCRRLIQELVELAKKYDKQVILTTHNPSVLDGLDLDDQEQKLYVIKRKRSGQTRAIQIFTPKPLPDQEPVPLSEAFLRGYIGGLPKNF